MVAANDRGASSCSSRVASLDLARGLAVLFMVTVHVLEVYAAPSVAASAFGVIVEYLGGPPAAPVFMFLMGVSLAFTSHSSVKKGVRRGVELVLLGYLLNLLRGAIPAFLAIGFGLVTPEDIAPWTPAYEFSTVDILHFAGAALVIVSLLRLVIRSSWQWICLAFFVAFCSPLLWGRVAGIPPVDFLLAILWGEGGEHVAFPVFPWLAYVLAGIPLGNRLAMNGDRGIVFRRGLVVGALLMGAGTLITLTNPSFHMGDYWRSGPGSVIAITGFVLVWLWICEKLIVMLELTPFFRLMAFWSRYVTAFYFVHWVIIGWGALILGHRQYGSAATIFLMLVVTAIADLLTRLWRKFRMKNP